MKKRLKDIYINSKFRIPQLIKYTIKIGYKTLIVVLILKIIGAL